tara:strand:- start:290 stop:952 length:663 start_codon:yes stop_codon:yes gene_type:complete
MEEKMKLSITKALLLLFVVSIQGCGTPEEEVEEKIERVDSGSNDSTDLSQNGVATPDNIPGTWIGNCIDDTLTVYTFSDKQWVQGILVYAEDTECRSDLLMLTTLGGTFLVTNVAEDGVVSWNANLVSFERTFYTQDLVDNFNQIEYHGYSDWVAGEAKECINKEFETSQGTSVIRPQTIYWTLQISEDDAMAFGSGSSSAQNRPTTVNWSDEAGPYTRQ